MQIPIYLRKVLPACALLALLISVATRAQQVQQPPQFQQSAATQQPPTPLRSETHAVLISVAVRDSSGRAVEDLRKEDFTVTDNGKPRDFQLFPSDTEAATRPAVSFAPNFFSNHYGPMAPTQGVTAILMDAANTPLEDQMAAREQAIKALENMTLRESVAIYAMTTQLDILQGYTTNRDLLLKAFASIHSAHTAVGGPNASLFAKQRREGGNIRARHSEQLRPMLEHRGRR